MNKDTIYDKLGVRFHPIGKKRLTSRKLRRLGLSQDRGSKISYKEMARKKRRFPKIRKIR